MNMNQANVNAYRQMEAQSGVVDASPHHLIAMLMEGALDRIAAAKGAMGRGETAKQGELLGKAISIIDNMRGSLDHTAGGELSARLADLYDYMERRLVEGGSNADASALDEVSRLMREVKSGWDEIPAAYRG